MNFAPELIMLLPVPFFIFLGVGAFIYWFSTRIAPKSNPIGHKLEPYIGGEKIEGGKIEMNYNLFYVAVFFTIIHVYALVLATILGGNLKIVGAIGAVFFIVGLISILVLLSK